MNNRLIAAFSIVAMAFATVGNDARAQTDVVSIIIVRHPESDNTKPTIPLSEKGQARADLLVHTLSGVKFTHFFASHTTRSRQAIEKIAVAHDQKVVQVPAPGSMLDGKAVTEQTTRRAPIEPLSEILLKLPAGSAALVGLNSENIYAILNKLGVPLASAGQGCERGSVCVPCASNQCYPSKEFDHLWHVVRDPAQSRLISYLELRYGAGWEMR